LKAGQENYAAYGDTAMGPCFGGGNDFYLTNQNGE